MFPYSKYAHHQLPFCWFTYYLTIPIMISGRLAMSLTKETMALNQCLPCWDLIRNPNEANSIIKQVNAWKLLDKTSSRFINIW